MDNSSQRKILRVSPACETPLLARDITAALAGNGPTLGFGEVSSEFGPSQAAVVIGTSGTTGAPKEIFLSSHALVASARASNAFVGAKLGDTWSLLLPLTHVAAVNVFVRAFELGTIPVDLRNHSGEYPRVNFTAIVPTQLFRALNGDDQLLKHLQGAQKVLVGGAALSSAIRNQATAAGINVVTTYGMSETSGGCVYNGEILEGAEVEVRGGSIFIRGSVLALNLELSDGWFETNDLGEFVDERLVVIGRSDDVIISGGENLSLNSVENILNQSFPNTQFAAFSVEDPQWGQTLHIAVVGEADSGSISSVLEEKVGAFAKPKGIHSLNSLPLLGIGKVDRKRLAQEIPNE
ncbi:MAG: AMP-binding protein [Candidatus Planktophila sp.]